MLNLNPYRDREEEYNEVKLYIEVTCLNPQRYLCRILSFVIKLNRPSEKVIVHYRWFPDEIELVSEEYCLIPSPLPERPSGTPG